MIKEAQTCPRSVRSVYNGSLFISVQTEDVINSEERMSAVVRAHTLHASQAERKTSKSPSEPRSVLWLP